MTISIEEFLNDQFNAAANRLTQVAKISAHKCFTNDLPILVAFTLCWSSMAQGIICIGVLDGIVMPMLAGFCGYTVAELFKGEKGGGESVLAEAIRFKMMGCNAIVGMIFGALKDANWTQYIDTKDKEGAGEEGRVLAI